MTTLSVRSYEDARTELRDEISANMTMRAIKVHLPNVTDCDSEYHLIIADPQWNLTLYSGWAKLTTFGNRVGNVTFGTPQNERTQHHWRGVPISWIAQLSALPAPTQVARGAELANRLTELGLIQGVTFDAQAHKDQQIAETLDKLLRLDPHWYARVLRGDVNTIASNQAVFRTPGTHFRIPGLRVESTPGTVETYNKQLIIRKVQGRKIEAVTHLDDATYLPLTPEHFKGAIQCPPTP